jgi:hypothetical protein
MYWMFSRPDIVAAADIAASMNSGRVGATADVCT